MNSALLEAIRAQGQRIVAEGIVRYEKKYSKFSTDLSRRNFEQVGFDLFLSIISRIENDEALTITPLKQKMLEALFQVDFNTELSRLVFIEISAALYEFINAQPNYDPSLVRTFQSYESLVSQSIGDFGFFSSSSALDIIQEPEEYQYCVSEFSFRTLQIDTANKRIYTLFPKERYWEEFSKLSNSTSYSPLRYNRIASLVGASEQRIPLNYQDMVIYEDKLYKLNSKIKFATRSQFIPDEWVEFSPRLFDQSKSFKRVFNNNIQNYYTGFLENGFDINEVISDSEVSEYSTSRVFDRDFLVSTFGGEGRAIYDDIKQLKTSSDYFGGHEGSVIGGVEYITLFSEYLLAAAFGRDTGTVFDILDSKSTFGQFDLLFFARTSENRIPGLSFLSNFGKLKSFAHSQAISTLPEDGSKIVVYNAVYEQFKLGIADTYLSNVRPNSYNDQPKVDLLLYSIESLFKRCLSVGDSLQAIENSLDSRGRLIAYEGLGSIDTQIQEFQRVFPPSLYIYETNKKIPAGLTGCVKYLLESYSRLSKVFVYTKLPGKSLEFILRWVVLLTNNLESIISEMVKLGIGSSNFIPNISINSFEPSNSKVSQYLLSLGFRDSEVNQLLSATSFSDLISKFAPLSDSDDLKSFFKAYELAQLIYEFGGTDGVNAYLSFLYSRSDIDSLLNILSLSQKDKSTITYIQIDKYPKLIGLLIGLTYAIDPGQLIKFNKILGENNLTLLESIEYLLESGQQNIIKPLDEIELLTPIVDQLIQGNYPDAFLSRDLNYSQANSKVPIALRQWTEIINGNLGGIKSVESIRHLYDKSVGLTPKELVAIINPVSPATELAQMVDGINGGTFTRFLKYASITSVALKLGYYKNSPQLNNFESKYLENFYTLPTLLEGLEKVLESLSLIKLVFESNLDYNLNSSSVSAINPLVLSQNKEVETIAKIISDNLSPDAANITANAPIVESPGIGNSRLPNRVPVENSLTPEQFRVLFSTSESVTAGSYKASTAPSSNLIGRFIKFSEANRLINLIDIVDETNSISSVTSRPKTYSSATKFEEAPKSQAALTPSSRSNSVLNYSVPTVYSEINEDQEISSQALGANFLRSTDTDPLSGLGGLVTPFDRVKSCQRFGGEDCEALYEDAQELCVGPRNKSLYAETYPSVPGSSPTGVYVDRPLGTFADYKPSSTLLPTSSLDAPPAYYDILPYRVSTIGKGGEPILSQIPAEPFVPDSGGYEVSELGNSEFGLLEFIRERLEKNTEFNCATFESPFHYQKCMNLMKCKKFSPPYNGKYFLPFCPKTLSGGRLR